MYFQIIFSPSPTTHNLLLVAHMIAFHGIWESTLTQVQTCCIFKVVMTKFCANCQLLLSFVSLFYLYVFVTKIFQSLNLLNIYTWMWENRFQYRLAFIHKQTQVHMTMHKVGWGGGTMNMYYYHGCCLTPTWHYRPSACMIHVFWVT